MEFTNTAYPKTSGGITDAKYSVNVDIQYLGQCLRSAGVKTPIDMASIRIALGKYNGRDGYADEVLRYYPFGRFSFRAGSADIVQVAEIQIGNGVIAQFASCQAGVKWFKRQGRWHGRTYVPASGDIIFFD